MLGEKEITSLYIARLDQYMVELKNGLLHSDFQFNAVARALKVEPEILSETILKITGETPGQLYEERILKISKELLLNSNDPIADIAGMLAYDLPNFTRFFKSYAGISPQQFRDLNRM